jgi:hypothetical protein
MSAIDDYALLADCHGAALVARDGPIDSCCMPRFDTGAMFGRLLDPDAGARTLEVQDGATGDGRYLNGTLVLETALHAGGGDARRSRIRSLPHATIARCGGSSRAFAGRSPCAFASRRASTTGT